MVSVGYGELLHRKSLRLRLLRKTSTASDAAAAGRGRYGRARSRAGGTLPGKLAKAPTASYACRASIMSASFPGATRESTMSDQSLRRQLRSQLDDIQAKGLYKRERLLQTPQGSGIRVQD